MQAQRDDVEPKTTTSTATKQPPKQFQYAYHNMPGALKHK